MLRGFSNFNIEFNNIDSAKLTDIKASDSVNRCFIPNIKVFDAFVEKHTHVKAVVRNELDALKSGSDVDYADTRDSISEAVEVTGDAQSVFQYLSLLKSYTDHTYAHSANVAMLCAEMGKWCKLSEDEIEILGVAGALHDTGKLKVPLEILDKPGRLTDDEFAVIKKHSLYSYEMLSEQNIPEEVKLAALQHHEKANGTGYPHGIALSDMTYFARIVEICDIWEAMTAERPYKPRMCPFKVMRIFQEEMVHELDTELMLCFIKHIGDSYLGTWVKLSNNMTAEVKFVNGEDLSKPIVLTEDGNVINLLESELSIAGLA